MRKHFLSFLVAALIPLVSWADSPFKITVNGGKDVVYAGDYTNPNITVEFNNRTLNVEKEYTVEFYQNDEKVTVRDAGEYTAKVSGVGDLSFYESAQTTFTVQPKEITVISPKSVYKTYGDATGFDVSSVTVKDDKEIAKGDKASNVIACLTVKLDIPEGTHPQVGSEPYTGILETIAGKNYTCKLEAAQSDGQTDPKYIFVNIVPAKLTVALSEATKVYNANTVTAVSLIDTEALQKQLKYDDTVEALGLIVAEKDEKTIKDVATYTLTVSLPEAVKNYVLADEQKDLTYDITKAKIYINLKDENTTFGKTYNGLDSKGENVTSKFTFSSDVKELTQEKILEETKLEIHVQDNIEVKNVTKDGYLINPYDPNKNGTDKNIWKSNNEYETAFNNYEIVFEREDYPYMITPAGVTISVAVKKGEGNTALAQTEEYGKSKSIDVNSIYTYDVQGIVDADLNAKDFTLADFFAEEKAPIVEWAEALTTSASDYVNAGTYNVSISNKNTETAKDNIVLNDQYANNYTIKEYKEELSYEVTQLPISAEVDDFTVLYSAEDAADKVEAYLPVTSQTVFGDSSNAGSEKHNVFLNVLTKDRYNDKPEIVELLEALQIFKDEVEIEAAEAVKQVGEYDLVIKATATEAAAIAEGAEPEYPTVKSTNYVISLVPGKLIVKGEKDLELDGDADVEAGELAIADKLTAYNGAKVESVTIKNIKNQVLVTKNSNKAEDAAERFNEYEFKAETWYTLILPFDVTAREISNAFGYAIVNVPNIDNTNPETGVFKLTMGNIDANTLMLIKTDAAWDWAEDEIVFQKDNKNVSEEDKTFFTIRYNEAPETVDGAGVKYRGLYEPKPIAGTDTEKHYILWDNNTSVYNVETLLNQQGRTTTVQPFGGYMATSKDAPANIRILVEDIDGTVTAINSVNSEEEATYSAEGWYTINGVKLNAEPTEKGIYINNGKKVVIK